MKHDEHMIDALLHTDHDVNFTDDLLADTTASYPNSAPAVVYVR